MEEKEVFNFLPFPTVPASVPVGGPYSGAEAWPAQVHYAFLTIARGPVASQINSGEALADAIIDIRRELKLSDGNPRLAKGLTLLFDEILSDVESEEFFSMTLPGMARYTLRLPALVAQQAPGAISAARGGSPSGGSSSSGEATAAAATAAALMGNRNKLSTSSYLSLRILYRQQAGMVLMSQELAAAILCAAFFCVFPTAGRTQLKLPEFNFDRLYGSLYETGGDAQEGKLRCLLNYFSRIVAQTPQGLISFERKVLPQWSRDSLPLASGGQQLRSSSSGSPSGTQPTRSSSSPGSGTNLHTLSNNNNNNNNNSSHNNINNTSQQMAVDGAGPAAAAVQPAEPPGGRATGMAVDAGGAGEGGSAAMEPRAAPGGTRAAAEGAPAAPQGARASGAQSLPVPPSIEAWKASSATLCPLKVVPNGRMEDEGLGCLQVDFANAFLGGGVLGAGAVQEEILFVICPELIVGMLFMPAMEGNETIEIVGAERFSSYSGAHYPLLRSPALLHHGGYKYASTFSYLGDYQDPAPRDSLGRRQRYIVAMDALCHAGERQFRSAFLLREVNKALCGFLEHAAVRGYTTNTVFVSGDSNSPTLRHTEALFTNGVVPTAQGSGVLSPHRAVPGSWLRPVRGPPDDLQTVGGHFEDWHFGGGHVGRLGRPAREGEGPPSGGAAGVAGGGKVGSGSGCGSGGGSKEGSQGEDKGPVGAASVREQPVADKERQAEQPEGQSAARAPRSPPRRPPLHQQPQVQGEDEAAAEARDDRGSPASRERALRRQQLLHMQRRISFQAAMRENSGARSGAPPDDQASAEATLRQGSREASQTAGSFGEVAVDRSSAATAGTGAGSGSGSDCGGPGSSKSSGSGSKSGDGSSGEDASEEEILVSPRRAAPAQPQAEVQSLGGTGTATATVTAAGSGAASAAIQPHTDPGLAPGLGVAGEAGPTACGGEAGQSPQGGSEGAVPMEGVTALNVGFARAAATQERLREGAGPGGVPGDAMATTDCGAQALLLSASEAAEARGAPRGAGVRDTATTERPANEGPATQGPATEGPAGAGAPHIRAASTGPAFGGPEGARLVSATGSQVRELPAATELARDGAGGPDADIREVPQVVGAAGAGHEAAALARDVSDVPAGSLPWEDAGPAGAAEDAAIEEAAAGDEEMPDADNTASLEDQRRSLGGFSDAGEQMSMEGSMGRGLRIPRFGLIPVATGNWGCGAFGGDIELKAMLQWMAASEAARPAVVYFTFGDKRAARLQEICDWVLREGWTVGELWTTVANYCRRRTRHETSDRGLFDWMLPRPDQGAPEPKRQRVSLASAARQRRMLHSELEHAFEDPCRVPELSEKDGEGAARGPGAGGGEEASTQAGREEDRDLQSGDAPEARLAREAHGEGDSVAGGRGDEEDQQLPASCDAGMEGVAPGDSEAGLGDAGFGLESGSRDGSKQASTRHAENNGKEAAEYSERPGSYELGASADGPGQGRSKSGNDNEAVGSAGGSEMASLAASRVSARNHPGIDSSSERMRGATTESVAGARHVEPGGQMRASHEAEQAQRDTSLSPSPHMRGAGEGFGSRTPSPPSDEALAARQP